MDLGRFFWVILLLCVLGCGPKATDTTPTAKDPATADRGSAGIPDDSAAAVDPESVGGDSGQPETGGQAVPEQMADVLDSDQPETASDEEAVVQQSDPKIAGLLTELIGEDLAKREAAAEQLDGLAVTQHDPLAAAMQSDDPRVRQAAAFFFLDRFDAADALVIQGYMGQLADEDPAVRKIALVAAKRFPPEALTAASPKIVAMLGPGELEANRATAARLLADLQPADEVVLAAVTAAASKDASASVRTACVQTVSRLASSEQAAGVLSDVLARDPDAKVRGLAAVRLGKLGPAAAASLAAALGDADDDVRVKAARSLGVLGQAAVEPLCKQLQHADPQVRLLALGALGSLGSAAVPAADSVRPLLQDSDPSVQQAAQLVLTRLQRP